MRKLQVCVIFSCLAAWSQTFTGSIRGTITDPTQAAVPNAKVIAIDVDRKVEFPTTADSSGRYVFPGLPPARYMVTVEAPGFHKSSQPAFQLEVQQQATLDIELTVGEMATTVEVTGAAPLLNTTSATLGQVVENKIIQSTPNSGRNPLSLVFTVPYGSFSNCLKTKETSPLEPDALENKFYAPGVGNVRTVDLVTGEILDLINIIPPP